MISPGTAISYQPWLPTWEYSGCYTWLPPVASGHGKSGNLQGTPETTADEAWAGEPRTELGRKLAEIRTRALAQGIELVSNGDILEELGKSRQRGA